MIPFRMLCDPHAFLQVDSPSMSNFIVGFDVQPAGNTSMVWFGST